MFLLLQDMLNVKEMFGFILLVDVLTCLMTPSLYPVARWTLFLSWLQVLGVFSSALLQSQDTSQC